MLVLFRLVLFLFFFFNDTATTEIYTLSLHDALPILQYGLPLAEAVPLFASLLSIPLGSSYAPLNVSPEQQKQKTLQAFLTLLLRRAAQDRKSTRLNSSH